MNQALPVIEIYSTRKIAPKLLFSLLIFWGLACSFLFWSPDDSTQVAELRFWGVVVGLFTLAGTYSVIKRALIKKLVVYADENGLKLEKTYLVPWEEITQFRIFEFEHNRMLVVDFVNPELFIDSLPKYWQRALASMSQKIGGSPITIATEAAVEIPLDVLREQLTNALHYYKKISE